jgi:arylsulfatase
VGLILDKLREMNIEDNTLVMFLSDNGGCAEFLREDGHVQKYDQVPPWCGPMQCGNRPELRPGGADTFMSYDLPWANASNSPLRLYKHWVHEGGIATPLICRWPAAAPAGGIAHQPCHVMDIMATCLDAAGVDYPGQYNGHAIQPLEGESFAPVLRGQESRRREREICWEHEGNRAVRCENWKLVSKHPGKWELYDMNEDRTELTDLAAKNHAKSAELEAIYNQWADRCGVLPWPLKK